MPSQLAKALQAQTNQLVHPVPAPACSSSIPWLFTACYKAVVLQGMFVTSIAFVPGELQFTPDEPAVLTVLNNRVLQQALDMAQVCCPAPSTLYLAFSWLQS